MGEKELYDQLKKVNDKLVKSDEHIKKISNEYNDEIAKSNEHIKKISNEHNDEIAKLEEKIKLSANSSNSDEVKKLLSEIEQKNKKITELAESVSSNNAPRGGRKNIKEKYGITYENKYTDKQIAAFEKQGIDTSKLARDNPKK